MNGIRMYRVYSQATSLIFLIIVFFAIFGVVEVMAASLKMVSNLNLKQISDGGSDPQKFTEYKGKLYFVANDGIHGAELWLTDGVEQPRMALDLFPGVVGASPESLVVMGSELYFFAQKKGDHHYIKCLWAYDGDTVREVLDADDYPQLKNLVVFNAILYFTSFEKIYRYDGSSPPVRVSGIPMRNVSDDRLIVGDSHLFFTVADSSLDDEELWAINTDNSVEVITGHGIEKYENIYIQNIFSTASGDVLIYNTYYPGKKWLYRAGSGLPSEEITVFKDLGLSPQLHKAVFIDDTMYFNASAGDNVENLWRYNFIHAPQKMADGEGYPRNPEGITVYDSKLYFSGNSRVSGTELWSCDGLNSPELVADINKDYNSNPSHLTVFEGRLYFSAETDEFRKELYFYDGQTSPQLFADINTLNYGSNPRDLLIFDNKLFFLASKEQFGRGLFTFDGVSSLSEVSSIIQENELLMEGMVATDTHIYFSVRVGYGPLYKLKSYDKNGQISDVGATFGVEFRDIHNLFVWERKLYFTASGESYFSSLWEYDGKTLPRELVSFTNSIISNRVDYASIGSKLYFAGETGQDGTELWEYVSHSSPKKIASLGDMWPQDTIGLTAYSSKLYFFNKDNPSNLPLLWSYDGQFLEQVEGDLYYRCLNQSDGCKPKVFQDKLYIPAAIPLGYDTELWSYDGNSPPKLVADLAKGYSSEPSSLSATRLGLMFFAYTPQNGYEPWIYQGEIPQMLANILPDDLSSRNYSSSHKANFLDYKGKIYFVADNGHDGQELYVYGNEKPPVPDGPFPGAGIRHLLLK